MTPSVVQGFVVSVLHELSYSPLPGLLVASRAAVLLQLFLHLSTGAGVWHFEHMG